MAGRYQESLSGLSGTDTERARLLGGLCGKGERQLRRHSQHKSDCRHIISGHHRHFTFSSFGPLKSGPIFAQVLCFVTKRLCRIVFYPASAEILAFRLISDPGSRLCNGFFIHKSKSSLDD